MNKAIRTAKQAIAATAILVAIVCAGGDTVLNIAMALTFTALGFIFSR